MLDVSPDSPVLPFIAQMFEAAARQSQQRFDLLALDAIARDIADHLNATHADVWAVLADLPDNLLASAHSPQGVTALAYLVGDDLGAQAPPLIPAMH